MKSQGFLNNFFDQGLILDIQSEARLRAKPHQSGYAAERPSAENKGLQIGAIGGQHNPLTVEGRENNVHTTSHGFFFNQHFNAIPFATKCGWKAPTNP